MSAEVTVICDECCGCGRTRLRPALQETYNALTGGWQTLDEIGQRIGRKGLTPMALANRLVRLLRYSVAERRFHPNDFKRLQYRRRSI